uniref:Uncharacterized protein n=1 Tax=Kalanchoe fedtschenkoi TaxID=63787 RepID=A0A7N0TH29_KALFE
MEKNIEEKLEYISSLNIQVEALQPKRSPEDEEVKTKMHARFTELSNKVDSLRKEIEAQEKHDLEVRRYTREEKIRELNLNLESLQKVSDEQRTRVSEIKHDIEFIEERLFKLKLERPV